MIPDGADGGAAGACVGVGSAPFSDMSVAGDDAVCFGAGVCSVEEEAAPDTFEGSLLEDSPNTATATSDTIEATPTPTAI